MNINQDQLSAELETLATFSDAAPPAVTRIVFTPTDMLARAYVRQLFLKAGLSLREDAVGNTFARWAGSEPELPPVAIGSHIDAIPNAGRYDGTVGVLGGLEAIRALQRSGFVPRRSIELVMFTAEEPTRFGLGCLGSRMLSGTLSPAGAAQLKDRDGKTLNAIRREAGYRGTLASVPLRRGTYSAFIELHIEQGPVLEREKMPLGIVTAIAAPASLRIFIDGEGGHAGAVLMLDRKDAFLAAAEIALVVESSAKATGVADTVGTVGVCEVFPGAINSIPSRVRLEVDIRDIDQVRRDNVLNAVVGACHEIGARRQVSIRTVMINADAPTESSPAVVKALGRSCQALGVQCLQLVSRAYHDSLFMSRVVPVGMLFIPCRDGVSHRPDEYASPEDITRGVAVLAGALKLLSET